MNLAEELRQQLKWFEYELENDAKRIMAGLSGIIDNHYIALDTIKAELLAISGEAGERLLSVFEGRDFEVQRFLINEAIKTILKGADYSDCRTMDDFQKAYAAFIYGGLISQEKLDNVSKLAAMAESDGGTSDK